MNDIIEKLEAAGWPQVKQSMDEAGYALMPGILSEMQCDWLKDNYNTEDWYRKTIQMERYRFGKGQYRYFKYPLPDPVHQLRQHLYPHLAPIANNWMDQLGLPDQFPLHHHELLLKCQQAGQDKPTPLMLQYGAGGFNTLHQDIYGDVFFPMQAVLFLNQAGKDYNGGEFVLTEQVPRAQSRATVLRPDKGDLLLFTTQFRPVKGTRGFYRVNIKHGVSSVTNGERYTLGVIFHDAQS